MVLSRPFRRILRKRLDCGGREIGIVIASLGVVTLGLLVVERPSCVVVVRSFALSILPSLMRYSEYLTQSPEEASKHSSI